MVNQEHFEEIYGPLASFAEHKPGDSIRYRYEGKPTSGTIIWVCAAQPDRELHLCYVVENDWRGGIPDVVFPSDVLTS